VKGGYDVGLLGDCRIYQVKKDLKEANSMDDK